MKRGYTAQYKYLQIKQLEALFFLEKNYIIHQPYKHLNN